MNANVTSLPVAKEALKARPGLSSRDIVAFVEAWSRGSSEAPLVDYLGWESGYREVTPAHDAARGREVAPGGRSDDHGEHVRRAS